MQGLRWERDSSLSLDAMSDPALEVRFDSDNKPGSKASPSSRENEARTPGRLSGLPRLGREILDGQIARR